MVMLVLMLVALSSNATSHAQTPVSRDAVGSRDAGHATLPSGSADLATTAHVFNPAPLTAANHPPASLGAARFGINGTGGAPAPGPSSALLLGLLGVLIIMRQRPRS